MMFFICIWLSGCYCAISLALCNIFTTYCRSFSILFVSVLYTIYYLLIIQDPETDDHNFVATKGVKEKYATQKLKSGATFSYLMFI
jgi:hypothetical protein